MFDLHAQSQHTRHKLKNNKYLLPFSVINTPNGQPKKITSRVFRAMVQRGYRALVLWVIWAAAAVIIYLGLYLDTEVWDFVQNDHSRITWAIIGLFGLGVAISFALTILLTLEFVKVDSLEHIAKRDGWLGIQEADKKGCVAEFFSSLRTIINNNGDLNIEALVDVEFSVYQRIAHSLEIIGNLLITLGLIGTVVGLTLTLTGLTSSLDALGHDQDQLLAGLRGAMAGMGTAFTPHY